MISRPSSYALGPCGSSQATAKLRHVAERVVGGTESLGEVAYHPSSAARFLPLASASCSLQRFNAIPCKFVCGQVYMVPGLSVSSIYPRSFSSLRPTIRLPLAIPLQSTPLVRPSLGQHSQERIHTSGCICARVSLSRYAHINVYTRCPKSRVLAAAHELPECCYLISKH